MKNHFLFLSFLLLFSLSQSTNAINPTIIDLSTTYTNGILWISAEYLIPSNTIVQNGFIKFSTNAASVILKGQNSTLKNVTVDSRQTSNPLKGIIELQNTNGALLLDVKIDGNNTRRAIYCNTTANNTNITNVDVLGIIGWGILFDDMDNVTRAVTNGYNYPLGKGLFINPLMCINIDKFCSCALKKASLAIFFRTQRVNNYKFGHENSTWAGDAIEINCPNYRFENIKVNGVLVRKTNKSGSLANGLGVAFAQCTNVEVRNVDVKNTGHDGIHFEHSLNCFVENFTVKDSWRAIGVSHSQNVTIRNGTVNNTGSWLISYNNMPNAMLMYNSTLENIVFDGCYNNGFLISNAQKIVLRNLTLKNYNASQNYGVIHFYNQSIDSVYGSTIENVQISRGSGVKNPLAAICVEDGGTGNVIKGVVSTGYEKKLIVDGNDFY